MEYYEYRFLISQKMGINGAEYIKDALLSAARDYHCYKSVWVETKDSRTYVVCHTEEPLKDGILYNIEENKEINIVV